jgi:hypothetical protein
MTAATLCSDLLTPSQAAEYIGGVKPQTLAVWRMQGRGPRFVKVSGRHVRYRVRDLDEFLAARVVETSESTAGA